VITSLIANVSNSRKKRGESKPKSANAT